MEKIVNTSSALKTLFGFLIPLPTISLAMVWLIAAYKHCHMLAILCGFPDDYLFLTSHLSISVNMGGSFLFVLMVAVQTFLFYQLRILFSEYADGKIFSTQNAKLLNRIALTFLSLTLVSVLVISFSSLFLIAKNITEFRSLLITAGILQGCNILISITLLIISWVVEEGKILKEDNEHTI